MTEVHDVLGELRASFAGQYDIEGELAGGGMSRLFVATERVLGRRVVIKVLPPELTSAVGTARFRRETEVTARLQHPNILPILSAGATNGVLFYVMPFVGGESLRARMAREGAFPVAEALRLLVESADALACAHAAGIIHRDIKPENVLLQSGHALLADFGVAAALSGDAPLISGEQQKLTRTGSAPGTVGYMAPEQLAGDAEVDARADVYSLGVVAWELLGGRKLFEADSAQALLVAHLVDDPEPLDLVRFDVPGHVARVVERALAKKPEERWQSAAELRDALQRSLAVVLSAEGGVERDPLGRRMKVAVRRFRSSMSNQRVTLPHGVAAPRPRRWPWIVGALLLAGGAAGGLYYRAHRAKAVPGEVVTVAVAPFRVLRADLMPELEVWREGILDVMARNLDGAGTIRTVAPAVVLRRGSGPVTQRDAAAFARAVGARYALVGEFVPTSGDSVLLKAWLVSASDTVVLDPEWRLPVKPAVDSLSFAVVRELAQRHRIGAVTGTPSLATRSTVALRDFLRGEQFYRRTAWDSAFAMYQRAVTADSTFALPLRRMALMRGWQLGGDDSTGAALAMRAGRFVTRLAPRDSLLISADSVAGALAEAQRARRPVDWSLRRRLFATVNEAAARYPDDPEVWYAVGEARFHHGFGAVIGVTERQTLEAFDRAIRLDSAFAPAYVHAVTLALTLDGAGAARRYSRAYLALHPADRHAASIAALDRVLASDPRTADALLDSLPSDVLRTVGWAVYRWPDSAQTGYRVLAAMDRQLRRGTPGFDARLRELQLLMANELAFRGRFAEAYAIVGDRRWRAYSELAYLGGIDTRRADSTLRVWVDSTAAATAPALPWWAERRDTEVIARFRTRAEAELRAAATGAARTMGAYRVAAADAYLALARGDTAAALTRFPALSDTVCEGCFTDRLAHARLLAARGRDAQAYALLRERLYIAVTPIEVLFDLERGRVAARLGRRDEARAAFQRVIDAWGEGDEAARRVVSQARSGLAMLERAAPVAAARR